MLCCCYHGYNGQAKFNVLKGRYPMRSEDYVSLAGLQAAIHEGLMSDYEHHNQ